MIASAFISVNLRPKFFHNIHAPVFTLHEVFPLFPRTPRAGRRIGLVPGRTRSARPPVYARQDRQPAAAGGQTTSSPATAGARASRTDAVRPPLRGAGKTPPPAGRAHAEEIRR